MGEDSFLQSRVFNSKGTYWLGTYNPREDLNRNSKIGYQQEERYTTQSNASSEGEELTEGKDLTGRPVRSMCRLI